ncbi:DUF397 domain-containing protein [Sphaerisporangium corydalis]|uniref:DUF397 domain-containing protein n=1 Tax=Sphaerisporangium corydalis TaxID=1441875 RepID=A0ABV9EI84_9ACTN|nr:DUF397 domain-containing protein [Sphaerisporangium corydalis]
MTDLTQVRWRRSSFSGSGNNCVEVSRGFPGAVAVRDSKNPTSPVLRVTPAAWRAFVNGVKDGTSR